MANDIVNINGGQAELNVTVVVSKGIDPQCQPIVTQSVLGGTSSAILLINSGVSLPITTAELQQFYPNTPAGIAAVKATF